MNKTTKPLVVAIAVATIGSLGISPVLADDVAADSTTSTTVVAPKSGARGEATKAVIAAIREYRTALREYVKTAKKGATPEFKAAVKAYAEARKAIDVAYRDAVKDAIEARKVAGQADPSKDGKKAAQATFLSSVAAAQAARTQAITDLGAAPTK